MEPMSSDKNNTSEFAEAVTGVFWDVVDCEIPNGLSLDLVCENIKSALKENGYRGKVSITAYCDVKKSQVDLKRKRKRQTSQLAVLPSAFKSSGIKLVHAGNRRARRNEMLDDMLFFALEHKPASLMVISQDVSRDAQYMEHLSKLKEKNRNLLLAQIDSVKGELFGSVSSIWYWRELANGGMPAFQSERSCLADNNTSGSSEDVANKSLRVARLQSLFLLWDYENCPIPYPYDVTRLYENIKDFVGLRNFEITTFEGFGTSSTMSTFNWDFLDNHDQINVTHIPKREDQGASDFKTKRCVLQYLIDKEPPSPCLVITGDQDFLKLFWKLRKLGFEIYLGYSDVAEKAKTLLGKEENGQLKFVKEAWHYYDIFGFDRADQVKRTRAGSKKRRALKKRKNDLQRQREGEA